MITTAFSALCGLRISAAASTWIQHEGRATVMPTCTDLGDWIEQCPYARKRDQNQRGFRRELTAYELAVGAGTGTRHSTLAGSVAR